MSATLAPPDLATRVRAPSGMKWYTMPADYRRGRVATRQYAADRISADDRMQIRRVYRKLRDLGVTPDHARWTLTMAYHVGFRTGLAPR